MLVDTKELTNVKDIINGFHVEAKRTWIGHWCGYITIPSTHPWAQSEEPYAEDCDINVHGGVTFYEKDNDGNTVVGFDCGHSFDASPSWSEHKSFTSFGGKYRDIYYVLDQLKSLASQASKI